MVGLGTFSSFHVFITFLQLTHIFLCVGKQSLQKGSVLATARPGDSCSGDEALERWLIRSRHCQLGRKLTPGLRTHCPRGPLGPVWGKEATRSVPWDTHVSEPRTSLDSTRKLVWCVSLLYPLLLIKHLTKASDQGYRPSWRGRPGSGSLRRRSHCTCSWEMQQPMHSLLPPSHSVQDPTPNSGAASRQCVFPLRSPQSR